MNEQPNIKSAAELASELPSEEESAEEIAEILERIGIADDERKDADRHNYDSL